MESQRYLLRQTAVILVHSSATMERAVTLISRDAISSTTVETKQTKLTVVSTLIIAFHFAYIGILNVNQGKR